MTPKTILVTGGAGYIGSHVLAALSDAGYRPIALDNFDNSDPAAVDRLRRIAPNIGPTERLDIRDREGVRDCLARLRPYAVIHMAGLKAVGESVAKPLAYYDCNVGGSAILLEELDRAGVRNVVFSSSATVYRPDSPPPFRENAPLGPTNPYGRTKRIIEQMLEDLVASNRNWMVANLRYFNPVGAHPSGLIGEDPRGIPNNLMPFVCRVAAGRLPRLQIFGDDYPTPDGTGVRDYIHVVDLAAGHVAALAALERGAISGMLTANLGTGRGASVKEVVETFEQVNGVAVPRDVVARRSGDVAFSFADCSLAREKLGFEAKLGLDAMCRDAWKYASAFGKL